jgi:UDP-N-acetylmuramoyl-L-alanyl-D-glutamate--2,6-diaminopimelate ligase
MGAAAISHADMVVVTSDNPRSERPSDIIDQILAGIPQDQRDRVTVQADRGRAIRHAIEHAAAGDVVVLAGKGHENEQVVAGPDGDLMRVHFDDAQQAHAALDSRRAHRASRPAVGPQ